MSKISELSDGGALQSTDYLIAVRSGGNVKVQPAGMTFSSVTITSSDINGGNIDGTVIGATTAAAGSFTTGQFGTSLNVDGTVTADGLTVDGTTTLTGDFNVQGSADYGVEFRGTSPSVDSIALQARFRDDTDAAYWGGANIEFIRDGNWESSITFDTSPDYTNRGGLPRLNIAKNGDISFYEDTGTTPKFFWDASQENVLLSSENWDVSAATGQAQIRIVTTSADAGIELNAGNSQPWYIYNEVNDLRFRQDGVDYFNISSSGNVGVGTDSPSATLEVINDSANSYSSTTGDNTNFAVRRVNSDGADQAASLYFNTSGNGTTNNARGYINLIQDGLSNDSEFSFQLRNSSAGIFEAMRITSAGNVGIGETSPASGASSDNVGLHIKHDNVPYLALEHTGVSGKKYTLYSSAAGALSFFDATSVAERMRIDSSGKLLAGATTFDTSNTGHGFGQYAYHTRDDGNVLFLNRKTSDGDIVEFRQDNSTVGSIGVIATDRLYIQGGASSSILIDGYLGPGTSTGGLNDNVMDCGIASARWDDVYATNAIIQTSDRNEKQDIEELSEAERRVAVAAKGLLRKFRWKDSVAEKGDDARIHFGIIAQDLQAAFEVEGLDAGRYAMFIHSTWTDEETGEERSRMGVRYSELLAFIIAAL